MSGPAFDEGLPKRDYWGEPLPYRCKKHADRVAVEPIAHRRCWQCMEHAINGYADAMIKRDKEWQSYYDSRNDTDIGGRNIRTTEATHAALSRISKEKPE